MADVFLSYRREERAAVETIASQLRALGLTVWFDAYMNSGQTFADEIDREVREAKAVLVCWSPGARVSRWVKAEALIGFECNTLAACYIAGPDQFSPPTPFNAVHTEDLRAWLDAPALRCAQWRAVLRQLGRLCNRTDIEIFGSFDPCDAEALCNRGDEFYANNYMDLAIADYTEALRLDPKFVRALDMRAGAYEITNKDLAVADYTEVMQLDPEGPAAALINRAGVYFDKGDFARAIADYTELIRLEPTDSMSYILRAYAFEMMDDYMSAIADYTEALRLDPTEPWWDARIRCYRAVGDDKCVANLEQQKALDTSSAG